jgi:zinc protease
MADDVEDELHDPVSLADLAAARLVFGSGPYGHAATGERASLERITREDVERQSMRLYRPDNAILVMTGDVDPDAAFALAERAFGDWARPAGDPPALAAAGSSTGGRRIAVDVPGAREATVMVTGPSIGRLNPLRYAVEVAVSVLGGGYSSRLNREIRIKRGLTYEARSEVEELYGAGLFSAAAETENAHAAEVAGLMLDELKTLAATAPPAEELAARKAALIGELGRNEETSEALAEHLARDAVYDTGPGENGGYAQKIEAVTGEEVQRAAAGLSDPSRIDLLVVGDARTFVPALIARFGAVEVISADRLDLASPDLR